LTGPEVKESKPTKTAFGMPFNFAIPLTTVDLLRNKVRTRDQVFRVLDVSSVADIAEKGVTMSIINSSGFKMTDGIHKMIHGNSVVLHIGTLIDGVWALVGIAICSGECSFNVTRVLKAYDAAAALMFEEPSASEWLFGDSGTGIVSVTNALS
jgi:urea transporter